MQNDKTKDIQHLRGVSLDESRPPSDRLKAASKLLTRWGATRRNCDFARKVVKLFENAIDPKIRETALKLRNKLEKKLNETAEEPESLAVEAVAESAPSKPNESILAEPPTDPNLWTEGASAEWFRLNHLRGTGRSIVLEALKDKPLTIENIRALYQFLNRKDTDGFPYSNRGIPIFTAVEAALREAGELPPEKDLPPCELELLKDKYQEKP